MSSQTSFVRLLKNMYSFACLFVCRLPAGHRGITLCLFWRIQREEMEYINSKEKGKSHLMEPPWVSVCQVTTLPSSVWRTRAQVRESCIARFSNSSTPRQWWHKYTRQGRRTNMNLLRPQGTCWAFSTRPSEWIKGIYYATLTTT